MICFSQIVKLHKNKLDSKMETHIAKTLWPDQMIFVHRYVKFDTFHPAVEKGLPVTRVISRFVLQKLLAEACDRIAGKNIIMNDSVVCDFSEKVKFASIYPHISSFQHYDPLQISFDLMIWSAYLLTLWYHYRMLNLYVQTIPLWNFEANTFPIYFQAIPG